MSYRLINAQGDPNAVVSSAITSAERMVPGAGRSSIMYVNVPVVRERVLVCVLAAHLEELRWWGWRRRWWPGFGGEKMPFTGRE